VEKHKYKLFLLTVFLAALIWSGINPPSGRADWLLENSSIFLAMLVFVISVRYIKLSNLSYTMIVIYLMFPLVAAHFGVTGVSLGNAIGHFIGTTRNMYDRLTHFLFGFLLFYPVQELVMHFNKNSEKESFWNYYIPIESILAFSALYEISEWVVAVTVNPILAASFYGSQGDIFDTPEDMANALVGALCIMLLVFLYRKYWKKLFKQTQEFVQGAVS
jgi:putative membrane protein